MTLGVEEERAWLRRNDAAHGIEMKYGSQIEMIRDVKLLKLVFHRLIMRITNACELIL